MDAMGGDQAPAVVVEGAVRAARRAEGSFELLLFGPEALLQEELARNEATGAIRIVDAPEVIGMAEAPAAAVKTKQASSIHRGLGAHRQGLADAFVSAGNTGAVMAASLFILGRLPGVARPTLVGYYPSADSFSLVVDVGSNIDCKPEHLVQFAQMGALYAERILKRPDPTVGLLNIGEEPGKGNEQTKAAYTLLAQTPGLHFRGNIEGRDLLHHAADVIICDGFVGNVILKVGESVATALPVMLKREMARQGRTPAEQAVIEEVFRGVLRAFNYEEYGGAPLLGVDGHVIIGHGSSSARAVERMIEVAVEVARQDVARSIASALNA